METKWKTHTLKMFFLKHSFTRLSKCEELKNILKQLGSQGCKHIQFWRRHFGDRLVHFKSWWDSHNHLSNILCTADGQIHSCFKSKGIQSDNNWSCAPNGLKSWLVWKKKCVQFSVSRVPKLTIFSKKKKTKTTWSQMFMIMLDL